MSQNQAEQPNVTRFGVGLSVEHEMWRCNGHFMVIMVWGRFKETRFFADIIFTEIISIAGCSRETREISRSALIAVYSRKITYRKPEFGSVRLTLRCSISEALSLKKSLYGI